MLKIEINDARNTKKFKIENVDLLLMKMLVIEVNEKKLKCEKLKRFRFIVKNNDRNRMSRKIENSNNVELELKNRNLKLTKLFLYKVIVESNRFIICFNLTNEICHSNEYDDKKMKQI